MYERDLFDVVNDAGYATALVGKNHSHLWPDRTDHWFGLGHRTGEQRTDEGAAFDRWLSEDLPPPRAGPEALTGKGFEWRWARHVCERRAAQRYPDRDWDEILPRMRANYFGMLRLIDDRVRRFVESLEDRGLRENTLLVCSSDHGDFAGETTEGFESVYAEAGVGGPRLTAEDDPSVE